MGSAHIDVWARQAIENFPEAPGDKPAHRRRKALDDAVLGLTQALRSTIRTNANRKGLGEFSDEVGQYASIAILQALRTWDPAKSCFNTHVHWKMRGEFATAVHQLLPERRKIKTIVPSQTISMDMDLGISDSGDSFDLHSLLADENATDDIERNCATNRFMMILDRYFSHKFAGRDPARENHEADEVDQVETTDAIRLQRGKSMRDRDMYLRHHFSGETLDQIGRAHNLTRERVRQITTKIDADIRQYFPDPKAARQTVKPIRNHLHPLWTQYLDAWEMYQVTMVSLPDDEKIAIVPEHDADAVPAVVEVLVPEEEVGTEIVPVVEAPVRRDAVVVPWPEDRPQLPMAMPILRRSATAFVVGMGMMAAGASAQTSRAIPPDAASAPMDDDDSAPPRAGRHRSAPVVRRAPPIRIVKLDVVKAKEQRWGVAVAEYPSLRTMQADWMKKRASWSMLTGLLPGAVGAQAPGSYRLIFGPIDKGQAIGLCHEAKRAARPCVVTTFGGVTQAPAARTAQNSRTDGRTPA